MMKNERGSISNIIRYWSFEKRFMSVQYLHYPYIEVRTLDIDYSQYANEHVEARSHKFTFAAEILSNNVDFVDWFFKSRTASQLFRTGSKTYFYLLRVIGNKEKSSKIEFLLPNKIFLRSILLHKQK